MRMRAAPCTPIKSLQIHYSRAEKEFDIRDRSDKKDTVAEGNQGVTRNGSLASRTDAVSDTSISISWMNVNTYGTDVTKMQQSETILSRISIKKEVKICSLGDQVPITWRPYVQLTS